MRNNPAHLIEIQDLIIECHSRPILKKISLHVKSGECLGIVGESGSGKSITASAILQLLPEKMSVVTGSIRLQGQELLSKNQKEMEAIRGRQIGTILQDPMTSLNPVLTVGEQLIEGLRHHYKISFDEAKRRGLELLAQMGINDPELRYCQYPHELSGGQRQRVLIAMALSCDPQLLIADEPTTALDALVQSQILSLIKQRHAQSKMGLLFISHDMQAVERMADRIIVMKEGVIVEEGTVQEVIYSPQHPYTKFLVHSRQELKIKGRSFKFSEKPILEVQNVSKEYCVGKKSIVVLRNISLHIPQGTVYGLVGESGSGKSTLGKCISNLLEYDSGVVKFLGTKISHLSFKEMIPFRKEMQIIFQNPFASLNPRYTIANILLEPLKIHKLFRGKAAYNRVIELMLVVGLSIELLNRLPRELSGGQRQRVAIARALAVDPKFIICDEILSSLDAVTQMEIISLLQQLQQKYGLSYLFISHDLKLLVSIADKIGVMYKGEIVEEGCSEEIFSMPKHTYTKELLRTLGKGQRT